MAWPTPELCKMIAPCAVAGGRGNLNTGHCSGWRSVGTETRNAYACICALRVQHLRGINLLKSAHHVTGAYNVES
jgi:hypothetical protein